MKETTSPETTLPVSAQDLLGLYRSMLLTRYLDEEEVRLKKSNRTYFQISCSGHEAIGVAAAHYLRPGSDWLFPYYRDRSFCVHAGMTAYEQLLGPVGSSEDPCSGARQMPAHWGHRKLHILSHSSPTATQFNQAVGCAEASRYIAGRKLPLEGQPDDVVYVSSGEGATGEGEFWEALNVAANRKLPVFFVVQDNEYAISVPVEVTTAGGDIARCFRSVPGLVTMTCDGNNIVESLEACRDAVAHVRAGKGPVLLRARVVRLLSHSLSDDQHAYRAEDELQRDAARDCMAVTEQLLIDQGIVTEEELQQLQKEVKDEVQDASRKALQSRRPQASEVLDFVYSDASPPKETRPAPAKGAEVLTIAQAINKTLYQEMGRDERIVVFGQDVADATRAAAFGNCKGKGGVFKVTHGLQTQYGSDRVFNTLLSENSIIGRAIGMALRGLKPVPEIQFVDFLWYAFMQIRGELATMRFRSAGTWSAPAVVRTPVGGYLRGGAIYHSQNGESIFVACPGLTIAYPSNASDAMGLLRAALRMDDPVMFLEHKHLYYQGYARTPDPGPDYVVPFGKAAIRKKGTDATVVTWGALVQRSIEAAERLKKRRGIDAEVIDLRTIRPLDMDTVYNSVRKTGRLLIAHEEQKTGGFGAELSAQVTESCFEWLDAPIRRVASKDVWVAYSPVLEAATLPQIEDVEKALEDLVSY